MLGRLPEKKQIQPVIEARELTKKFGDFIAVDRISFSVNKGEIVGFLGPNGAGKTTTLKMINGLLRPTEGEVHLMGYDVRRELKKIKPFLGYMSQKFSLYPLLTSLENIEFFGGISGLKPRQIKSWQERLLNEIPPSLLKREITQIPPGIRQQVALSACLMPDPEVILLDEPTSGVDPETRRNFWMRIYQLKKQGKTLLVTTHNLDEAEFADRILIINKGKIIVEGEPSSLMDEWRVSSISILFEKAIKRHESN